VGLRGFGSIRHSTIKNHQLMAIKKFQMKKQYEKMMKMMFGEVKITTCELQNLL
jgi:hypothetical protein